MCNELCDIVMYYSRHSSVGNGEDVTVWTLSRKWLTASFLFFSLMEGQKKNYN